MRIFCIKSCTIAAASPRWPPAAESSASRLPCCYTRLLI